MKRFALILLALTALSLACRFTAAPLPTEEVQAPPPEEAGAEDFGHGPTPTLTALVETPPPVPTEGLALHLPLDGSAGESAQASNTASTSDRFGGADGALDFNGVDSRLTLTDADALDLTGAFTIAFFIQGDSQSDHEWLIMTKHQAGVCQPEDTSWMIRYQAEMGLRFVNYDTSVECGKVILAAPEVNLLDDQWHHIAWVYDPAFKALRLYVDGALEAEALEVELNIQNNSIPLIIGNQYEGVPQHALDAAVDDVYIYQIDLTPEQVSILAAQVQ